MYILVKKASKSYLEEIILRIIYCILNMLSIYFLDIYLFVCACINITTTVVTDVVN